MYEQTKHMYAEVIASSECLCSVVISGSDVLTPGQPSPHSLSCCEAVKGLVVFSPELEAVAEGCLLAAIHGTPAKLRPSLVTCDSEA